MPGAVPAVLRGGGGLTRRLHPGGARHPHGDPGHHQHTPHRLFPSENLAENVVAWIPLDLQCHYPALPLDFWLKLTVLFEGFHARDNDGRDRLLLPHVRILQVQINQFTPNAPPALYTHIELPPGPVVQL